MNLYHGNSKLQNKFQFATSTRRFRADETFYVSQRLFQPIEFSFFRSLIAWIQPIKLRKKREFDRLEKIWQFYQPSSCLSKKKRLFYLILRGKTLFFPKKKNNPQHQCTKHIFSK